MWCSLGVTLMTGNGGGTFTPGATYAAGGAYSLVVAADVNNDGAIDLSAPNAFSGGTVSILQNNGDGTFKPYTSYSAFSAPFTMAGGDFNHDGYEDFAVANSYTNSAVTVILNNGDGTYAPPTIYLVPDAPFEIEVGDFNGDNIQNLADRGPDAFEIQLGKGDGTFYPATSYITTGGPLGYSASGDFNGDGAPDIVTPTNFGSINVLTNANNDRNALSTAVGFSVSMPASAMAGSTVPMNVTAVDSSGNAVSNFAGTFYITSNDPLMMGQLQAYTFMSLDAGTHTFLKTVTLNTAGSQVVSVAAPFMTTADTTVLVSPKATHFGFSTSVTAAAAGDTVSLTVSALDALGNPAAAYNGTVNFSSSDFQAVLPPAYTFTPSDAGVHTFNVTLKTAGADFIGIQDNAFLYGAAYITVNAGPAAGLSIAGGAGAIGIARIVVISALDDFGNVDTSYNGTLNLTTTDAAATLPTSVAIVNGRATTSVTLMTVGADALTATDPAADFTITTNLNGAPAVATGYTMTATNTTTAGAPLSVTITVNNSIGQVGTDYTGTVYFSSSDLQAGLPASYTFTAQDGGVHTFSLNLKTAGNQIITARDAFNSALVAAASPIVVSPAAVASFAFTGVQATTAGQAQNFTLVVRDAFGNVATNYTGTVKLTSTDTQGRRRARNRARYAGNFSPSYEEE